MLRIANAIASEIDALQETSPETKPNLLSLTPSQGSARQPKITKRPLCLLKALTSESLDFETYNLWLQIHCYSCLRRGCKPGTGDRTVCFNLRL